MEQGGHSTIHSRWSLLILFVFSLLYLLHTISCPFAESQVMIKDQDYHCPECRIHQKSLSLLQRQSVTCGPIHRDTITHVAAFLLENCLLLDTKPCISSHPSKHNNTLFHKQNYILIACFILSSFVTYHPQCGLHIPHHLPSTQ